jgi:fido (protein-threonine AMPylation protein)
MNNKIFAQKFNNITLDDVPFQNLDFDLLEKIHLYLFAGIDDDAGKKRCSDIIMKKINLLMYNLQSQDFSNITVHEMSEILCETISIIRLFQPFYDGNTKTLVTFLKLFLMSKKINFSYEVNEYDEHDYKKFINLIYSDDDHVNCKTVKIIENYIEDQYSNQK